MFGGAVSRCQHWHLGKIQHSVPELTYMMSVELDPSLIPACTLPYEYTDSYGISFKNMHVYFQPVAEVMVQHMCGCHHDVWCIWPHTWIFWIYLQDTKIRHDCMSYLTSVIGEFSKLRHFASYVSRHNAMVYDTCPHKWSYQMWNLCGKNLDTEKINRHNPGGSLKI